MFENKKIFILGMARSGYEAAKVLAKRNNTIVLNDFSKDQDESRIKELESMGIKIVLGEHPDDLLDETFDYIIKNPGIHFDHKYLEYASNHNIKVINEIEMAYHLLPSGVKIIAITGTNGKTTTTTLTYEIIKTAFPRKTHLAGNIGYPLCEVLEDIKEDDILVMEIGVPQLHDFYDYHPHIAVLTNIYEAHLDMFGTREYYNENKKRIFMNQDENDFAIINKDNSDAYKLGEGIKSSLEYFSRKENADCYLKDDKIYYKDELIVDTKDVFLKGKHNYENIMCAIMISKKMGVPLDILVDVIKNFKGVEHRIEFVKTIAGITFYNDSKATNIKATQIALASFKSPVILLLGGLERGEGQNFLDLKEYLNWTKLVVCYGECKNRIQKEMTELSIDCLVVETLEEATKLAYKKAKEGDTILLSPASASWDQYKNFEIRGTEFKNIVYNLEKEEIK